MCRCSTENQRQKQRIPSIYLSSPEELRQLQDRTWVQPVTPIRNDADRQTLRDVAEEARKSLDALRWLKLPTDEAVTATIDHLTNNCNLR